MKLYGKYEILNQAHASQFDFRLDAGRIINKSMSNAFKKVICWIDQLLAVGSFI